MDLRRKTVFITGGARRLGRSLAVHLSQRGCDLVVHYNTSHQEALALQRETGCRLFRIDFASIAVEDLQNKLESEVGDADVLINNASSFTKAAWRDVDEATWDKEMAINLKIPFFLSQFFGKKMKQKGAGKILNLADIAGQRSYLNYLPYSIAKAGVIQMTSALARALAPEVQVNAIAPGTILFVEGLSAEAKQKIVSRIPAGRSGTVDEFLRTVEFLLAGGDYITGQTIVFDGGRTLVW